MKFVLLLTILIFNSAQAVVAFKDAAKIKSWDAWNDHKGVQTWKEKRCVTREKILKMDPGLKPMGQMEVRESGTITSQWWSVGCETLDRDYADWDQYSRFLPTLGVTHARLFSGWAKTEQAKGVYDFAWLDKQVREMSAMGIKPWICISYGNPVWGSDFRLGMRVKQVTENAEAFAAWLKYVRALVERYKDVVDEWEIWNEPFNQANEYAKMVMETARTIKEVQPQATCIVTAVRWPNDYKAVLEQLKSANALNLVKYWAYHPYTLRPEDSYRMVEDLRKLVKSYSSDYDIMQGEVGCPAQLEFGHALNNYEWTEYSQAKWNLRRAIGDRARNIKSNCFTFIDLQYTFMLQSFGLIRSNTLKEPVYRRPSFFAMQNVYSFFDDDVHARGVETVKLTNGVEVTIASFERQSNNIKVVWISDRVPSDKLEYTMCDLSAYIKRGVWCDLMTGRVYELTDLTKVPLWDSPVLIGPNGQIARQTVWQQMTPAQIVDTIYRPWQQFRPKMDITGQPWLSMANKDFLPCFDKFGQFKYRDWPGKTHNDEELRAGMAAEEADLAAHPGPADWDEFGGWAAGPKLEASGRFRVTKHEGKWWLVDPNGYLFWSWGPVRVTPSSAVTPLNGNPRTPRVGGNLPDRDCLFEGLPKEGDVLAEFYHTHDALLWPFYLARGETRTFDFSAANLFRKYGKDWFEKFSASCHRRLRSWGANTIANSSDLRICLQDRTPYAERVECASRPVAASWGTWKKFRDPFDASFKEGCRKALAEHGREAHDPWCIGFFIDNEIQWGRTETDLAQWVLWSPEEQPARIEFVKRLAAKGIDPRRDTVPAEKLKAFTRVMVDEYFKRTREAVKEFDAQLLYLGCRFAGHAPEWVIDSCAKYCDVVSYNIYANKVDAWRLPHNIDAPVLVGEFHFGAHDRGLFGGGLIVKKSQAERAAAIKTYVESALANPQLVGVHWHQFSDQPTSGRFDGEHFQVGWTDVCDKPYAETVDALRSINLYQTRNQN